jgi:hypothetical protein
MIWAGLSKKGKLPLVFVKSGVKINTSYYVNTVLKTVLKPHANILFRKDPWIFQQDSAPAHKSKMCQKWCSENLPGFITTLEWPPSSPDLNPLDYCIWGILEEKVNATRHRSLESLKAAIIKEWHDLRMESVRGAINAWPGRLRSTMVKKGGRFE